LRDALLDFVPDRLRFIGGGGLPNLPLRVFPTNPRCSFSGRLRASFNTLSKFLIMPDLYVSEAWNAVTRAALSVADSLRFDVVLKLGFGFELRD
jgi:hypothetical protein